MEAVYQPYPYGEGEQEEYDYESLPSGSQGFQQQSSTFIIQPEDASTSSAQSDRQLEKTTFRMVGTVIMMFLVVLVAGVCVFVLARPGGSSGKLAESGTKETDEAFEPRQGDELHAATFTDDEYHVATWPTRSIMSRHKSSTSGTGHTSQKYDVKGMEQRAGRLAPRGNLICVFTFGEARSESYPDDGICDYAVYVHLQYLRGSLLGLHKRRLRGTAVKTFFEKSKQAAKTVFLAALSPETQNDVSKIRSPRFASQVQVMRRMSDVRGLGIILEYYSSALFHERHNNFVSFLRALQEQLKVVRNSLVFFGVKLHGMQKLADSSKYIQALRATFGQPALFILITHFSTYNQKVPEPTAAWTSNLFNDKDSPSLGTAVAFLRALQPPPGVRVFLSLTLAVMRYDGATNCDSPPALGDTCKGSSLSAYREDCLEPGFVLNDYDSNEMAVFEVDVKHQVDRCYETVTSITDKVNRVKAESGSMDIGWALFNVEFEDSTGNGCSRESHTFPRIKAIRKLLSPSSTRRLVKPRT